MSVPVGYKFRPPDQELVIDYLGKKSKGKSLPCNVIFSARFTGPETKLRGRFSPKTTHGQKAASTIKRRHDSKDTKIFPRNVKCTKKSTGRAENVEVAAASDADVTVQKPTKCARREFEQEQNMEAPETETVPYSRELSEAEKEGNHSRMLSAVMDAELEEQKQGNYSQVLLDMDADLEERVLYWSRSSYKVSVLIWTLQSLKPYLGFPRHLPRKNFQKWRTKKTIHECFLTWMRILKNKFLAILESEQLPNFGHDFNALDPHTLSRLAPRPFSKEFLEVERQENYSQRLSDMDADFDELVSILQWEPLPSFDLNFDEELVSILQWKQLPSFDLDFDALGPQVVVDKFCLILNLQIESHIGKVNDLAFAIPRNKLQRETYRNLRLCRARCGLCRGVSCSVLGRSRSRGLRRRATGSSLSPAAEILYECSHSKIVELQLLGQLIDLGAIGGEFAVGGLELALVSGELAEGGSE
ncbi:hypothetical protein RHSIM_RhsimUnG0091600 [Rhododendron simsii]|uniref:NAC domain-containing protein n=1 Tax=Rhododendron simsii TaxID=118357 RepID=A0A834FVX7_RHOSS|nr:hypothetical protein RHSIM_RhsimUnG0091600 [Rhododendron simsii]